MELNSGILYNKYKRTISCCFFFFKMKSIQNENRKSKVYESESYTKS